MTICRADPTTTGATVEGEGEGGRKKNTKNSLLALKASEFASSAIKTALIPNTNMDSVKHKQRKLLTNTLALGINHMHAQTNNAQNTDLANRLRAGKLPTASTRRI